MIRMMLSDAQWDRIDPLLPGKAGDPGRSGTDNRLFLEAVLWLRRAVAGPARGMLELPAVPALQGRVREHLHGAVGRLRVRPRRRHHRPAAWSRRKGGHSGHRPGGLTTKILVDALGTLARFVLLPGQRHDSVGVEPLIAGVEFDALIADKAFDIDWIGADLNDRGPSSRPRPTARSPATSRSIAGATWSRTSSAISRSSVASPPAMTKPTSASPPPSISSAHSSPSSECPQTLV